MFAIDLYQPIFNKKDDDHRLIKVSKIFAIFAAIITLFLAPNLVHASDGVFLFVSKFAGFIAIPLACLIVIGLFGRKLRIPPIAAQFIIVFHIVTYYALVWGLEGTGYKIPMHWMHVFTILFILESAIVIVWSKLRPHSEAYEYIHAPKVAMTPWTYSMLVSALLLSCAALTYVLFSKVGFAYPDGIVAPSFWIYFFIALVICTAFCLWAHKWLQPKYEIYVSKKYG